MSKKICEFCKNSFKNENSLIKHKADAKYCLKIQKEIIFNSIDNDFLNWYGDNVTNKIEDSNSINNDIKFETLLNQSNNFKQHTDLNIGNALEDIKQTLNKINDEITDIKYNNITLENKIKTVEVINNIILSSFKDDEDKNIDLSNEYNNLNIDETDKDKENLNIDETNKDKENLNIDETNKDKENLNNDQANKENLLDKDKLVDIFKKDDSFSSSKTINIDYYLDSDKRPFDNIENKLYNNLEMLLSNLTLDSSNISKVIIELMQFIGNFDVKNSDKKNIVIYVLKKYIENNSVLIHAEEMIKLLPHLIDIFTMIDARKIKIKKNMSCFFPMFS